MTRNGNVPAPAVLAAMGFAHQPGTGYKPELDLHQTYINPALPRLATVTRQLEAAGYRQTTGRKMFKVYGGRFAASFERNAAYANDRLDLDSVDGVQVGRIVHYCGRSND